MLSNHVVSVIQTCYVFFGKHMFAKHFLQGLGVIYTSSVTKLLIVEIIEWVLVLVLVLTNSIALRDRKPEPMFCG